MLKLVKMDEKYIPQLNEMMDEWTNTNEKIVPWSIGKCDYHNIGEYIESLEIKESFGKYVPDTTFFCLDTDRNLFIGAITIRHYLNEDLASGGGHVGAGIRPGERGKGYGTKMLSLALEECVKLDLKNSPEAGCSHYPHSRHPAFIWLVNRFGRLLYKDETYNRQAGRRK